MTPITPLPHGVVATPAQQSAAQPETGWQRVDRYAGYLFFAIFAVGGALIPLSFMVYSWIR